jgi:hypothetical protein
MAPQSQLDALYDETTFGAFAALMRTNRELAALRAAKKGRFRVVPLKRSIREGVIRMVLGVRRSLQTVLPRTSSRSREHRSVRRRRSRARSPGRKPEEPEPPPIAASPVGGVA